jgi:single-stranded-DNA-specific exonuclease
MEFIKRNTNLKFNYKLIDEISEQFKISKEIVKIIYSKGNTTKKDIVSFLQPSKNKLYDPYLLNGVSDAVKIIKNAIGNNLKITIIGDYDTDGMCATAILYKWFNSINYNVSYFLPNRFVDGYGLTNDVVDKIIELYNPNLIITVDCGISSFNEIEYVKNKGINVIVTDHHEIPNVLPNCTIINPKLKNQEYPFKELCGAGVALKLVQALGNLELTNKLISIAMLATVADIVPLINENRTIVYNGLKKWKENLPVGILTLIKHLDIKNLTSTDISFKIAPKLNTAGRMGDATVAFKLLIENNETEIEKTIDEINQLNEKRVSDGEVVYNDCMQMLLYENISRLKAIVLFKENWTS